MGEVSWAVIVTDNNASSCSISYDNKAIDKPSADDHPLLMSRMKKLENINATLPVTDNKS
jgi:hypothetical protein